MKLHIDNDLLSPNPHRTLCLTPESDADQRVLEQIQQTDDLTGGFGRHAVTGEFLHASIALDRAPDEEAVADVEDS